MSRDRIVSTCVRSLIDNIGNLIVVSWKDVERLHAIRSWKPTPPFVQGPLNPESRCYALYHRINGVRGKL